MSGLLTQIEQLASNAQFLNNIANAFIVRPVDGIYGIDGFMFSKYGGIGDEEVSGENDITDHYVEENYAVNDHIAIKPLVFRLTGYVGEIRTQAPQYMGAVDKEVKRLNTLSPYLPKLTAQAQQIYNNLARYKQTADNVISTTKSSWDIFQNKIPLPEEGNRQRIVYEYFMQMRQSRRIISVEMPWGFIPNASILSVSFSQRDSKFNSEVNLTVKEIRITQDLTTRKLVSNERAALQKQSLQDKGLSQGVKASGDSALFKGIRLIAGD
jgi:hypothetical protein